MAAVTKDSKADPVEAFYPEANGRRNAQAIDVTRAAAGASSIAGYAPGPVTLLAPATPMPFIDMNPLLPTGKVDSSDIRDALQALITNYSRVRLIRYVRTGDNFTYNRFAYVVSPDSSTSEQTLIDFGIIFAFNPIDQSEYLEVVAQARVVMQNNFNTLFAVVPYCHVQCHTDNPPPPPPTCHTDQIFTPQEPQPDGGDGGGSC